jgi:hypothetical protein
MHDYELKRLDESRGQIKLSVGEIHTVISAKLGQMAQKAFLIDGVGGLKRPVRHGIRARTKEQKRGMHPHVVNSRLPNY